MLILKSKRVNTKLPISTSNNYAFKYRRIEEEKQLRKQRMKQRTSN